ncbi:MAG: hypothetical protein ABIO29_00870, partial [Sphingomicrobium sp.]
MNDQTKIDTANTLEAPAKAAVAVIETASNVAKTAEKTTTKTAKAMVKAAAKPTKARRARKLTRKTVRKAAKRVAATATTRTKVKATSAKATKIKAAGKVRAAQKRIETMTSKTNSAFNFGAFDNLPAFAPFQNLFTGANERGQDLAVKSQKVAEQFADLAKANVEAIVEASTIAVEGTKSLG